MTRINFGIPPKQLTDKHLLAEHREIKRIPNLIINKKARYRADHSDIPTHFSLGIGHVKFFYNKIMYLHLRYITIYNECVRRKFNVQSYESCFILVSVRHPELYNNAKPKNKDKEIIRARIRTRLNETPQKFNSSTKYK